MNRDYVMDDDEVEREYVQFTLGTWLVYDEDAADEVEALAEYVAGRMNDGANLDRLMQSLVEALLAIMAEQGGDGGYLH